MLTRQRDDSNPPQYIGPRPRPLILNKFVALYNWTWTNAMEGRKLFFSTLLLITNNQRSIIMLISSSFPLKYDLRWWNTKRKNKFKSLHVESEFFFSFSALLGFQLLTFCQSGHLDSATICVTAFQMTTVLSRLGSAPNVFYMCLLSKRQKRQMLASSNGLFLLTTICQRSQLRSDALNQVSMFSPRLKM